MSLTASALDITSQRLHYWLPVWRALHYYERDFVRQHLAAGTEQEQRQEDV